MFFERLSDFLFNALFKSNFGSQNKIKLDQNVSKSSEMVMPKAVLTLKVPATRVREHCEPQENANVVVHDPSFAQSGNSLVRVPAGGRAVAVQS